MKNQIDEINKMQNLITDAINNQISLVTKSDLNDFLWHVWDRMEELQIDLKEMVK